MKTEIWRKSQTIVSHLPEPPESAGKWHEEKTALKLYRWTLSGDVCKDVHATKSQRANELWFNRIKRDDLDLHHGRKSFVSQLVILLDSCQIIMVCLLSRTRSVLWHAVADKRGRESKKKKEKKKEPTCQPDVPLTQRLEEQDREKAQTLRKVCFLSLEIKLHLKYILQWSY